MIISKSLAKFSTQKITEVADFLNGIKEIKRRRIDASFHSISKLKLVIIPDVPVKTEHLYDLNNTFRNKIGKKKFKLNQSYHQTIVSFIQIKKSKRNLQQLN